MEVAYRSAYKCNYSRSVCSQRATELLKMPVVIECLAEIRNEMIKNAGIEAHEVIKIWKDIATADITKIVRYEIACCRYCHGKKHQYQWTPQEFKNAVERWEGMPPAKRGEKPTASGGFGYHPKHAPVQDCLECFGHGHASVVMTDTRKLTGKEKLLYAGCKVGKHGIEMLTRNQDAALVNIAKHLGMFVERFKEEGKVPAVSTVLNLTVTDPIEASKIYQQIMTTT
jgi:phage terminase small subunit